LCCYMAMVCRSNKGWTVVFQVFTATRKQRIAGKKRSSTLIADPAPESSSGHKRVNHEGAMLDTSIGKKLCGRGVSISQSAVATAPMSLSAFLSMCLTLM